MSGVHRTVLETPDGFASREVARVLWQMEDQRRLVIEQSRGASAEELGWQPAPGMNTIGMLLAHIAVAETNLVQVGVLGMAKGDTRPVIGINPDDDGLPLPADGSPPAALAGRSLEYFDDLLASARTHTRAALAALHDADLERVVRRPPRPDGTVREFNVAWVLYHILEHEAGHRGQIALLRRLWEARPA